MNSSTNAIGIDEIRLLTRRKKVLWFRGSCALILIIETACRRLMPAKAVNFIFITLMCAVPAALVVAQQIFSTHSVMFSSQSPLQGDNRLEPVINTDPLNTSLGDE
jgi:hypothetical protein